MLLLRQTKVFRAKVSGSLASILMPKIQSIYFPAGRTSKQAICCFFPLAKAVSITLFYIQLFSPLIVEIRLLSKLNSPMKQP